MEQIFGKGVSKGVAAGPISFYRRPSGEIPRRSVTDTAAELARFHDACETAKEQLGVLHDKALAEAGEDAAMLFEAHQMMLDDLDFVESIEGLIENDRLNAEAAVSDTGAQFAEMFAAMDDSYMQARAADIRDISTRVIGILTGEGESGIVSDVPCIVAADDLAPSETVQLDKSLILGFITAGGSANSHTAILARTMGIPAIIGAGDALQTEMEGKYAIVDGQTGEMVIEPDDAERERLLKKQAKEKTLKELLDQLKGKPNVTKDGRNVMVYCNIGSQQILMRSCRTTAAASVCSARNFSIYRAATTQPRTSSLRHTRRSRSAWAAGALSSERWTSARTSRPTISISTKRKILRWVCVPSASV